MRAWHEKLRLKTNCLGGTGLAHYDRLQVIRPGKTELAHYDRLQAVRLVEQNWLIMTDYRQ